MNFTQFNLDSRLMAGVTRLGYTEPTQIQSEAIPLVLAGRDLIGTAQTGTGKTAAFVLPILNNLLSSGPRRQTRVLIVTPTRELAEQIHETIQTFGRKTSIRSATIYGGVPEKPQIKALHAGVEIIVACPGRLLSHIEEGYARLGKVEVLVLDEADRMLDMGFIPDVRRILKHIPVQRQTMMFSATFPREIEQLAKQTLHNPKRISVGITCPAHTVAHALYPVAQRSKTPLLLALLEKTSTDSVLIFARTKHRTKRLAQEIEREGYRVTSLHSDRTQGQRQAALKGFKCGEFQIMVATDIAARGLDIASISHVINFDMPATADDYIHRIGRTGRAQRTGDAFTLVTPEDNAMVRTLERIMKWQITREMVEGFDYTSPPKPRLKLRGYKLRKQTAKHYHRSGRVDARY